MKCTKPSKNITFSSFKWELCKPGYLFGHTFRNSCSGDLFLCGHGTSQNDFILMLQFSKHETLVLEYRNHGVQSFSNPT